MKHFSAQILIDLQEEAVALEKEELPLPKFLSDIIEPDTFTDEEYKIGFVSALLYTFQIFTEMNRSDIFTESRYESVLNNMILQTSKNMSPEYLQHVLAAQLDPSIEDEIYLDTEVEV